MNLDTVVDLQQKRVLVSGGTRGMGAAAVQTMAGLGAKVLVTARTAPDAGDGRFIAVDAALPGAACIVADAVMRELGGVDVIVHCVGADFEKPGGALALSDDDWDASLSTNLKGPSTRCCCPTSVHAEMAIGRGQPAGAPDAARQLT